MKEVTRLFLAISFMVMTFSSFIQAQFRTPYLLSWQKDVPLGAVSIGMGTSYFFLNKRIKPLSQTEILSLDDKNINHFDRAIVNNFSKKAANISDVFFYGSACLPALLFIDSDFRKDWKTSFVVGAQAVSFASSLTLLTKSLVKRPRPFVYNNLAPASYYQEKGARYSFFSGHTSVVSVSCFTTAKIYSDYNPNSKLKPYIWASAAIVPAVTGYLRVKAGKHFISDVIVGYLVGAISGILIPELHKRNPFSIGN